MIHITQAKEQFSLAFVKAVAAAAGFSLADPKVDDDSIDCSVMGQRSEGQYRSPRLELQVKCTSNPVWKADFLHFPLKIKNYNDLRLPRESLLVPRLLVVLVVPEDTGEWLHQSEEELTVRHCAYCRSLSGAPETGNSHTVTVQIPKQKVFDTSLLCSLMSGISKGEWP